MNTTTLKVISLFVFGILSLYANPSFAQRKSSSDVAVRPHFRSNGTFIDTHMRSAPDKTAGNNFSSKGNINPYTGLAGKKYYPEFRDVGNALSLPRIPTVKRYPEQKSSQNLHRQPGESSVGTVSDAQQGITVSDKTQPSSTVSEATISSFADRKANYTLSNRSLEDVRPGRYVNNTQVNSRTGGTSLLEKYRPTQGVGQNIRDFNIVKWRRLKIGSSKSEVEKLLGSPKRIEANNSYSLWFFSREEITGFVKFDAKQRVSEWSEPR